MATNTTIDFNALWERIQDHRTAMLTTVSPNGFIHSRPMMTQEREAGSDLWFVTSINSEKVDEIKANPKVGVLYYRDADNAYVSVAGTAHIEQDGVVVVGAGVGAGRLGVPGGRDRAG